MIIFVSALRQCLLAATLVHHLSLVFSALAGRRVRARSEGVRRPRHSFTSAPRRLPAHVLTRLLQIRRYARKQRRAAPRALHRVHFASARRHQARCRRAAILHETWSRDALSGATVVCIDPCSSAAVIAQVLRQASCSPPLNLPKFGSNAWNASNEHSSARGN